jgi:alpha-1,6-mannosyltransferase
VSGTIRASAARSQQSGPREISTLHLTNAYHEQSGGIRTLYHALLDRAEAEGRRMTLVVPARGDGEERRGRTTTIVHVRAPRSPAIDSRYRLILPHRFLRPGHGPLWTILEKVQPDVIEVCDKHSLCYFAGLVRRRRGVRTAPALVGLSCERLDDNLEIHVGGARIARAAARAFLGRAYIGMFDLHIANSEYTAEELRTAMRRPHIRPVHVCRMGVDHPGWRAIRARPELRQRLIEWCGGREDAWIVMYAGRLSPEKHVLVLPETIAAAGNSGRPLNLIVVGDGPLRERLEAESSRLAPGRVHFLGHVQDRAELSGLLSACDAFLHVNPHEPFGIGPLEAMAVGTPVVMPAAGGLLDYATHENAWLGEPGALSLAAALRACLGRPAERARRAANARVTAERHAWPLVATQFFRLYEAAAAGRFAAAPRAPFGGAVPWSERPGSC